MANELIVPKLGESISEAVIGKWLKQVGDAIAVDEPVVDLETDKVSVALPAPIAGVLLEQRFQVGATVKVGEIIGSIDPKGVAKAASKTAPAPAPAAPPPSPAAAAPAPPVTPAPAAAVTRAPTAATGATTTLTNGGSHRTLPPSVRKAIREGENGLMPTSDISPASSRGQAAKGIIGDEPEEIVAFTPLRKRIAERLVEAQHTAAILTTFNEVDLSQVMALRAKYQDIFVKEHGIKLGFMSFFVHACVEALKRFPGLNAEVRGTDIAYKKYYHFGIAVGSGRGLVVPVVRHVDQLSFAETEKEILRLAERAKNNQLTLDELSHGTFSITNGGVYGSLLSTPLLNMPQTAILGMHNIVKRPIVVDDQVVIRPMMYLAVSYDHRVVDGREAVQFLVNVKERLESPERLMLGV